ncbi:MAG: GNAT family N-acetyltransferase [Alphaproteobacteria bacterium]|jgi:GNAT superfamily N-acetyltransferase
MNTSPFFIRLATAHDASPACKVIRESITHLCVEDHKNREDILYNWLENKTPDTIAQWIADTQNIFVVAQAGDEIVSVGAMLTDGYITLNYVLPDWRYKGISRAILAYLEKEAHSKGLTETTLTSTKTAHSFYAAHGYVDQAEPTFGFGGKVSFPMKKFITKE